MEIIECPSHDEYLATAEVLRAQGRTILRVYSYWYEGAGERRLVTPSGTCAKAMWDRLSGTERMLLNFAVRSSKGHSAETLKHVEEYRDCLKRDYDKDGGYTICEGPFEKAVTVIEFE